MPRYVIVHSQEEEFTLSYRMLHGGTRLPRETPIHNGFWGVWHPPTMLECWQSTCTNICHELIPVPPPVIRLVIPCIFSWTTIEFSNAPSLPGYKTLLLSAPAGEMGEYTLICSLCPSGGLAKSIPTLAWTEMVILSFSLPPLPKLLL